MCKLGTKKRNFYDSRRYILITHLVISCDPVLFYFIFFKSTTVGKLEELWKLPVFSFSVRNDKLQGGSLELGGKHYIALGITTLFKNIQLYFPKPRSEKWLGV